MPWPCRQHAESCRKVITNLSRFMNSVPRDHIDIAALITDLDSTVKVLETLDDELRNPASRRLESYVAKDVEMVLDSLSYSDRLFGTLFTHEARLSIRRQSSYETLWKGFTRHVEMIESTSMPQRLDWYRSILQEAITTLRGEPSYFPTENIEAMRIQLRNLRRRQQSGQSSVRSERDAPPLRREATNRFDHRPTPSSSSGYNTPEADGDDISPQLKTSPLSAHPPRIPSPELPSASSGRLSEHWAKRIFDGRYPVTAFNCTARGTYCNGRNDSSAPRALDTRYARVLVTKLVGDIEVLVSLYWDDRDSKGNILLTMNDKAHERSWHYPAHAPLPLICARRSGSGVRLMIRTHVGAEMTEWAFLEFATYERMILFSRSFTALKYQDRRFRPPNEDASYRQEEIWFTGKAKDDDNLLDIRLLRDQYSEGVRLEACKASGSLRHMPVWTAFIPDAITHSNWVQRPSPSRREITLSHLHMYVFSDRFEPRQGPDGEFDIRFVTSEEAGSFLRELRNLRRRLAGM